MRRAHPLDIDVADCGLASWSGVPHAMARPHRHNEIEMNLLERGTMTYLLGGERIRIGAGSLGLFWGAMPHQLVAASRDARCHWVTLPLAWFLQWRLPGPLTYAVMHGKMVLDADRDRHHLDLAQFAAWAKEHRTKNAESRAILLLEAQARLRRLAGAMVIATGPHSERARRASSGATPAVDRLAREIAERYTEPVGVDEIARAAGLHPKYATTLFKRAVGMGLLDYLVQHRLSHAQLMLATTEAGVLQVAMESGFGSLSRFHAVFTRACRCSPARYRRSLREIAEAV
jgi:AraC-like DNA-binding protein